MIELRICGDGVDGDGFVGVCHYFFFFKQKTAYEMRISDWSSDVCSSDLPVVSRPFDLAGFRAACTAASIWFRRRDGACGPSDHEASMSMSRPRLLFALRSSA